jgi:three-Cys-motif partner protein
VTIGNLFDNLPLPGKKPLRFKPARHPIWTENKAKLIERYLYYFVLITKHGVYIDGFAGPQSDKSDGWAAKLVLESKPAFLRRFVLCEISPAGLAKLNELVANQPAIKGRSIEIFPGDFNANVGRALAASRISENTAAFCLLDQRTFECEWATVQSLAGFKASNKIELFYFLGTGWFERAVTATTRNPETIDRWWGSAGWRDLEHMKSFDRAQLVTQRFKGELGYKHAFAWPIYGREVGGRVMYHMIHASDHDEAPKLMSRAYRHALQAREPADQLQKDMMEEGWITAPRVPRPPRRD